MNGMIDSTTDKKNIGLLMSLSRLRQALDVYCLIAANADAIEKRGQGKKYFRFLRTACA
jgi:hypothetical protein